MQTQTNMCKRNKMQQKTSAQTSPKTTKQPNKLPLIAFHQPSSINATFVIIPKNETSQSKKFKTRFHSPAAVTPPNTPKYWSQRTSILVPTTRNYTQLLVKIEFLFKNVPSLGQVPGAGRSFYRSCRITLYFLFLNHPNLISGDSRTGFITYTVERERVLEFSCDD